MEQTQDIKKYCIDCKYKVFEKFQKEEITLKQARQICANCKFGKNGIYKFDIVFAFTNSIKATEEQAKKKPTGKKETYTRRYGTAIKQLQAEGKSVRQIAEILGISPTTIVKITKQQKDKE